MREVLQEAAAATAAEIVDRIVNAVTTFSGREPRDDVAVVALRVTAAS